jgi:hypothetical protein
VPHLPYTSAAYSSRDPAYSHPETSFVSARGRQSIDLTSTGPYSGTAGQNLRLTFKSHHEYLAQKYSFVLEFGAITKVNATLSRQHIQGSFYHYNLNAQIPEILGINRTFKMPLMIDIQDENTLSIEHKNVGDFYYGSMGYQPYAADPRKRKLSEDPSDYLGPSAKRSSSQPLQPLKFKDSSSVYSGQQLPHQPASPYATALYAIPGDRSAQRSPYAQPVPARNTGYGYTMSPTMAPQAIKLRSPVMTTYGSYPPMSHGHSPQMPTHGITSTPLSRSVSQQATSSTPTWVRTTELRQQQSTPRASPYGPTPTFNPYAQYPDTKANLNILGDLGTMCDGWTNQEKSNKRRLVEFQRAQSSSTITATFKAVSADERSATGTVISCIWWARKRAHYVTSVDTIGLLEGLVAVKFTVEEKNRIRRNLEGFKPYTVSKNKDESDDIFRLIMGFGAPKPRNIEKDIKIFPWSILNSALKKIISKYVSYAPLDTHAHRSLCFPPTTFVTPLETRIRRLLTSVYLIVCKLCLNHQQCHCSRIHIGWLWTCPHRAPSLSHVHCELPCACLWWRYDLYRHVPDHGWCIIRSCGCGLRTRSPHVFFTPTHVWTS